MERVRVRLIHALGGVTKREVAADVTREFSLGRLTVSMELETIASNLYGTSADHWCEVVYRAVKQRKEESEKVIEAFNGEEC